VEGQTTHQKQQAQQNPPNQWKVTHGTSTHNGTIPICTRASAQANLRIFERRCTPVPPLVVTAMRWIVAVAAALLLSCSNSSTDPTASAPNNRAPVIDSVVFSGAVIVGTPTEITCYAHDPDGDTLAYFWRVADGTIVGSGARVQLLAAPCCTGNSTTLQVVVRDPAGARDSREISVFVW
jgi:hypothetical protein